MRIIHDTEAHALTVELFPSTREGIRRGHYSYDFDPVRQRIGRVVAATSGPVIRDEAQKGGRRIVLRPLTAAQEIRLDAYVTLGVLDDGAVCCIEIVE